MTMSEQNFALRTGMHLHLVGIGGVGISAVARVLLGRGFVVSGSDMVENEQTTSLQEEGAIVFIGHDANHITGAEAVITSSAVSGKNPELIAAEVAGIPIFKRADFLGYLMSGSTGIAIAGSHGKTTTTGMIAHILLETGNDPTVILGGVLTGWNVNGRAGQGDAFVIEADEYDYMFLGLKPQIAVITNIEHDHPDIFPTQQVYEEAFRRFAHLLPPNGQLILCGDDLGTSALLNTLQLPGVKIISYGLPPSTGAQNYDYQAVDTRPNQLGGSDFLVQKGVQILGLVRLRIPGLHNVRNALAAIIIALELGLEFSQIYRALAGFGGVGRRFQVTGEIGGVTIIDDYAHHPTEIKATLAAAKQRYSERRIWAIWQPHTYSRTKLLLDQFAASFSDADRVIILDIYRSRETDTLGLNGAAIIKSMDHPSAVYIPEKEDAINYLLDRIHTDDVVCTLGAGDGNLVGKGLFEALQQRVHTYHL